MRSTVLSVALSLSLLAVGCAEGYGPEPLAAGDAFASGAAGTVATDAPQPVAQDPAPATPQPATTMPTGPSGSDAMEGGDGASAAAMAGGSAMVDCNVDASVCGMALQCCKPDGSCGIGAEGLLCL